MTAVTRTVATSDAVLKAEEDEDTYSLTLKAKSKWAVYDKLRLRAGKGDLLPRKLEAFSTSDVLIKSLVFSETKDFGDGIVRPAMMETQSPLWPGAKAVMVFGEIRKRDLSDEVFTVNYMPKINDMRF